MTGPTTEKVPAAHRFLDLSDYARPWARWLVAVLLRTPVTPHHLTLGFTVAGLAAAWLFAQDRLLWLAGALLLLKSGLDAADGALARARQRPSRVGRFLDSVGDFIVNVAVYAGIAWGAYQRDGSAAHFLLALVALLSGLLQVSLFNHYYVRYRAQTGGDTTSQVQEAGMAGYAWDDPRLLAVLYGAYRAIYGWQDRLVARLAGWRRAAAQPLRPGFLTATTVLGLGTQLLVIAICAALGQPEWALWLFATVFNVYALGLILASSRRHAA